MWTPIDEGHEVALKSDDEQIEPLGPAAKSKAPRAGIGNLIGSAQLCASFRRARKTLPDPH